MDDAVSAALSYFDSVDPALAADARAGWDGLVGVSPPAGPTQHSVQTYLWVYLRHATESSDRALDVARALGELLDRLGRTTYAQIARSPVTEQLLTAEDDAVWSSVYREASAQSGIGAADTESVTWQDIPIGVERAIVETIGETLEVATIAGEFDPARPGGRPLGAGAIATRRRGITDAMLRADSNRTESSAILLEQLLDHRVDLWSGYSAPRAELYLGVREALHEAAEPVYGCVRRLENLVGVIGDGVTLTESGYLPDEVVARIATRLWPVSERPVHVGREIDTEAVLTLRRLLMRLRVLRRAKGRLIPTAKSRTLSSDGLWRVLVGRIVGDDYHPDAIAAEVVLVHMIGRRDVADARALADHTALLLRAEGWTHSGDDPAPEVAEPLARDLITEFAALGAFEAGSLRANDDGVRLAAGVLRHRLMHTPYPAP